MDKSTHFERSAASHLSKLLASQLPICLCPFDLSGVPLHLEVLVTLATAEVEHLMSNKQFAESLRRKKPLLHGLTRVEHAPKHRCEQT